MSILKSDSMTILSARRAGQAPRRVFLLPWQGGDAAPWRNGYSRVGIPYNEVELRNARNGQRFHTQIVKNSRLIEQKGHRPTLSKSAK